MSERRTVCRSSAVRSWRPYPESSPSASRVRACASGLRCRRYGSSTCSTDRPAPCERGMAVARLHGVLHELRNPPITRGVVEQHGRGGGRGRDQAASLRAGRSASLMLAAALVSAEDTWSAVPVVIDPGVVTLRSRVRFVGFWRRVISKSSSVVGGFARRPARLRSGGDWPVVRRIERRAKPRSPSAQKRLFADEATVDVGGRELA